MDYLTQAVEDAAGASGAGLSNAVRRSIGSNGSNSNSDPMDSPSNRGVPRMSADEICVPAGVGMFTQDIISQDASQDLLRGIPSASSLLPPPPTRPSLASALGNFSPTRDGDAYKSAVRVFAISKPTPLSTALIQRGPAPLPATPAGETKPDQPDGAPPPQGITANTTTAGSASPPAEGDNPPIEEDDDVVVGGVGGGGGVTPPRAHLTSGELLSPPSVGPSPRVTEQESAQGYVVVRVPRSHRGGSSVKKGLIHRDMLLPGCQALGNKAGWDDVDFRKAILILDGEAGGSSGCGFCSRRLFKNAPSLSDRKISSLGEVEFFHPEIELILHQQNQSQAQSGRETSHAVDGAVIQLFAFSHLATSEGLPDYLPAYLTQLVADTRSQCETSDALLRLSTAEEPHRGASASLTPPDAPAPSPPQPPPPPGLPGQPPGGSGVGGGRGGGGGSSPPKKASPGPIAGQRFDVDRILEEEEEKAAAAATRAAAEGAAKGVGATGGGARGRGASPPSTTQAPGEVAPTPPVMAGGDVVPPPAAAAAPGPTSNPDGHPASGPVSRSGAVDAVAEPLSDISLAEASRGRRKKMKMFTQPSVGGARPQSLYEDLCPEIDLTGDRGGAGADEEMSDDAVTEGARLPPPEASGSAPAPPPAADADALAYIAGAFLGGFPENPPSPTIAEPIPQPAPLLQVKREPGVAASSGGVPAEGYPSQPIYLPVPRGGHNGREASGRSGSRASEETASRHHSAHALEGVEVIDVDEEEEEAAGGGATKRQAGGGAAPGSSGWRNRASRLSRPSGQGKVNPLFEPSDELSTKYPCTSVFHRFVKTGQHASRQCAYCASCHWMEVLFNGRDAYCSWRHEPSLIKINRSNLADEDKKKARLLFAAWKRRMEAQRLTLRAGGTAAPAPPAPAAVAGAVRGTTAFDGMTIKEEDEDEEGMRMPADVDEDDPIEAFSEEEAEGGGGGGGGAWVPAGIPAPVVRGVGGQGRRGGGGGGAPASPASSGTSDASLFPAPLPTRVQKRRRLENPNPAATAPDLDWDWGD